MRKQKGKTDPKIGIRQGKYLNMLLFMDNQISTQCNQINYSSDFILNTALVEHII
jgi:hypothetical protein